MGHSRGDALPHGKAVSAGDAVVYEAEHTAGARRPQGCGWKRKREKERKEQQGARRAPLRRHRSGRHQGDCKRAAAVVRRSTLCGSNRGEDKGGEREGERWRIDRKQEQVKSSV